MSKEGSLEAPTRHALDWQEESFYDPKAIHLEMERVFDICHGCRRCFNLCDSFPFLFDAIDATPDEQVQSLTQADFSKVVDKCTLCDMCYMTKCPYVPPHEFNLDFPHLMLRKRAADFKKRGLDFVTKQIIATDTMGKIGTSSSALVNWMTKEKSLMRPLIEKVTGIDKRAALPQYAKKQGKKTQIAKVPETQHKVALFATCIGNYNDTSIVQAAAAVLTHNGIHTEIVYPECCGMPLLEQGDIGRVAHKASKIAKVFLPYIDKGYQIITPVASCSLMLKSEWPLILPHDADVQRLAAHTKDISQYIVEWAEKGNLKPGLQQLEGSVAIHIACHARAQNMGRKAEQMLRLIPNANVTVVERCSGHGGSWGILKENFDTALKVGKPAGKAVLNAKANYLVSECPLAVTHLRQIIETDKTNIVPESFPHPIVLFAKAYGL